MTCVAALQHEGRVYMTGDSAGVAGDEYTHRSDSKLFFNSGYLIGVAGSFRAGQVARYLFDPPPVPEGATDDEAFAFMVREFVPALCAAFGSARFEVEPGSFNLLVARGARMWELFGDCQVAGSLDGLLAVGIGRQLALATLRTFKFMPRLAVPPKTQLDIALRNAAHFSTGVLPPFPHLFT